MGMDRVYVALAETPVRVYVWSADGSPYPSGWPEAALTLPEDVEEIGLGTVGVRNVALLPPGAAKTTLMKFGVQGWACVSLLMPGRARGILGFDTLFRPAWGVYFPRAVVRLAGDAIGNAIERELFERDRVKLAARSSARSAQCRPPSPPPPASPPASKAAPRRADRRPSPSAGSPARPRNTTEKPSSPSPPRQPRPLPSSTHPPPEFRGSRQIQLVVHLSREFSVDCPAL